MAEGLMKSSLESRGLERAIRVDSAGTHASQLGHPADSRAVKILAEAGVDIRRVKARQMRPSDFRKFQYILCMDNKNLNWLTRTRPADSRVMVALLGQFGDESQEVPDPYYGSLDSFRQALEIMRPAVEGFIDQILIPNGRD